MTLYETDHKREKIYKYQWRAKTSYFTRCILNTCEFLIVNLLLRNQLNQFSI